MNFVEAVQNGFRCYGSASGRAARSEFWYWTLFSFLISCAGAVIDVAIFGDSDKLFAPLFSLALLLPDVAVAIRRMHDLDRSGWWLLIYFTGIGVIVLLIWDCMKGTPGANRFGADPLAYPHFPDGHEMLVDRSRSR